MNIDASMINKVLGNIHYPVGKADLVKMAQQHGANDQVTSLINRLPDKTYNSQQDLQNDLSSMGKMGGMGKMGDMGNMGGSKQ